jgi:hypothetical protein
MPRRGGAEEGRPRAPWRMAIGRLSRLRAPRAAGTRTREAPVTKNDPSVPFVVGRLGKDDRRLVVLDQKTPPPIQGPFELRAVFSK